MSYKSWMPLYIGDFMADVAGLSSTEVGAYMLLILAYWNNGGPLPNDKERIRRILRHPKRFESLLITVSQYFTVTDTHYTHQRIDKELNKSRIAYGQRALGASITNAKRTQSDPQQEQEPQQDKDKVSLNDVSKVLKKATAHLNGTENTWTPEQKKMAWQSKICAEAQLTMTPANYTAFLEAWTAGEASAKKVVEVIDRRLKESHRRRSN